jgi:WhiB family transcriptional regulator, redox-sensing transcriptional regulator
MAPMQWPGTTGVLEGLTGVPGRTALKGSEPDDQGLAGEQLQSEQLQSQDLRSAELPCRDDPELFFAESPEDVEFAKSLCGSCAARLVCLAGAIQRAEPWGVWGGELFLRGEIVPRKRPRGRPRKDAVAA